MENLGSNNHAEHGVDSKQSARVGLIGLGYWGPNILRVLAEHQDVTWICDLDADRLQRFGRRYPAAMQTEKAEEVFQDDTVDAILIATPVFTHYPLVMRSLAAGKHTFVEKPLAPADRAADLLLAPAPSRGLARLCGPP